MPALFEITDEILRAFDTLVDSDGEVSNENIEALETLSQVAADKLDSFYWCIRKAEVEEAAAKEQAERFLKKAKARKNAADWLKDQVKAHLEMTGQTKAVTPNGNTFAVQKNGGKRPVVTMGVTPEEMPYSRFVKVKTETSFNFDAIREALDAGDPEAKAFADYGEPGFHLRLR